MISKSVIKRWNQRFKEATAAEKRVIIAKDVIAQIKLGRIKPKNGSYLFSKRIPENKLRQDVQSNFDELSCKACALGSMLVCMVKSTNNAKFYDLVGNSANNHDAVNKELWGRLIRYFGKKQLALIEAVFEGWVYDKDAIFTKGKMDDFGYDISRKQMNLVNAGNKRGVFPKPAEKRLVAIMKNVIRNKGEFKPAEG